MNAIFLVWFAIACHFIELNSQHYNEHVYKIIAYPARDKGTKCPVRCVRDNTKKHCMCIQGFRGSMVDAAMACNSAGGHLATLGDASVDQLKNFIDRHYSNGFWIDLKQNGTQWMTSNGITPEVQIWRYNAHSKRSIYGPMASVSNDESSVALDAPRPLEWFSGFDRPKDRLAEKARRGTWNDDLNRDKRQVDENCAVMSDGYDFFWSEESCKAEAHFVCEGSAACDNKASKKVGAACYLVVEERKNFLNACKYCKDKGLNLVQIDTPAKQITIKKAIYKQWITLGKHAAADAPGTAFPESDEINQFWVGYYRLESSASEWFDAGRPTKTIKVPDDGTFHPTKTPSKLANDDNSKCIRLNGDRFATTSCLEDYPSICIYLDEIHEEPLSRGRTLTFNTSVTIALVIIAALLLSLIIITLVVVFIKLKRKSLS